MIRRPRRVVALLLAGVVAVGSLAMARPASAHHGDAVVELEATPVGTTVEHVVGVRPPGDGLGGAPLARPASAAGTSATTVEELHGRGIGGSDEGTTVFVVLVAVVLAGGAAVVWSTRRRRSR